MSRIDRLIVAVIFGSIPPISIFLSAVGIWFYAFQNFDPKVFALSGILIGILIDLIFLKKLIRPKFDLPIWTLVCAHLFYNTIIFGFFMGFPVFNLLTGMLAGYYFGKRIRYKNPPIPESKIVISRVSFFTTIVMLLVCTASAILAISYAGTGKELQHMFGLPFEISREMVWLIVLIGGTALIVSQYYFTKLILTTTLKFQVEM